MRWFKRQFSLPFPSIKKELKSVEGIFLAEDYHKNSGLQWNWAMASLKTFFFNPDDKVLDVGCGDGKITAIISKNIPKGMVVGIDISKKMIQHASKISKRENLRFIQGNAAQIPFKSLFDKVVSFSTLHWVLDQKEALKSMKECLKNNGIMLLIIPGKAANNLATLSEKVAKSDRWSKYFPKQKQERVYFTLDEYKNLLIEIDLDIHSLVEIETINVFENKQALINWIKPLITFIHHLAPSQQSLFIENLAEEMLLNDPENADGSISIRQSKIEVIALKREESA